jgi:hypothetical protein
MRGNRALLLLLYTSLLLGYTSSLMLFLT